MNLYFENSYGEERLIASDVTEDTVMKYIRDFCNERNFTIYYIRIIGDKAKKTYDVGSHTEFFHLKEN